MRRVFAFAMMLLLLSMTGCRVSGNASDSSTPTAGPTMPRAMKGYELYSWQVDGEWHFSLLEGTNRLKTFEEVTNDTVAVKGIDSIERKLGRLSMGEQVFWTRRDIPNTALPPEGIVNKIKEFCERSGINIIVTE